MKLKNGFILRQVGGEYVVVAGGKDVDLNGMITLNDTARTLWNCLESGATEEDLVKALLEEYDVEEERAQRAVLGFVKVLKDHGFLES